MNAQKASETALSTTTKKNDVMHASYYWCFIGMTTRLNGVFRVCKVVTEVTASKLGNSDKIPLDPVSRFGSL